MDSGAMVGKIDAPTAPWLHEIVHSRQHFLVLSTLDTLHRPSADTNVAMGPTVFGSPEVPSRHLPSSSRRPCGTDDRLLCWTRFSGILFNLE